MQLFNRPMMIVALIQNWVLFPLGGLILLVFGHVIKSMVDRMMKEKGWDNLLLRFLAKLPTFQKIWASKMFWLALGSTAGVAVALWLVYALGPQVQIREADREVPQLPENVRATSAGVSAMETDARKTVLESKDHEISEKDTEIADLKNKISILQSTLTNQNEITSRKSEKTIPTNQDTPPINWDIDAQFIIAAIDEDHGVINSIYLQGNTTDKIAPIKDASIVSGLTGHSQEFLVNVSRKGYFKFNDVDLPPNAPIVLESMFKPPLSIQDFLDQWGRMKIVINYTNGSKYEKEIDEQFLRYKIRQNLPDEFGPRVSPKIAR